VPLKTSITINLIFTTYQSFVYKNAHSTLFYSCTPILSFYMQSIIYETMHRSKTALCIFFAESQRRFASAIEVMAYISRHRWKYRNSPFRVNSGIVLCASLLFLVLFLVLVLV